MKKFISLAISLIMIFNFAAFASADEAPVLEFNDSGKFRIMVINDTHDDKTTDSRLIKGLEAALRNEKPDLSTYKNY